MVFPFLLGRAFIEVAKKAEPKNEEKKFPFLLGRAFIEVRPGSLPCLVRTVFPFLLGRAFIEVHYTVSLRVWGWEKFPFRLGRAFIEVTLQRAEHDGELEHFPSFWEGLSLR